jgi:predicted transcriptional regulator of viral defense system
MVKRPNPPDHLTRLVALARRSGILRAQELAAAGIPRLYLGLAVERGLLTRVDRGIYSLPNQTLAEPSLATVCAKVPQGIVCLLSALRFHRLGTQIPPQVHLAIGNKDRAPKINFVKVVYYRFSGSAFRKEIETRRDAGSTIRVYSVAKTIADCFKFRHKLGLDVAVEALRAGIRERRTTVDDLVRCSRICRVEWVMRPYLEAILS